MVTTIVVLVLVTLLVTGAYYSFKHESKKEIDAMLRPVVDFTEVTTDVAEVAEVAKNAPATKKKAVKKAVKSVKRTKVGGFTA